MIRSPNLNLRLPRMHTRRQVFCSHLECRWIWLNVFHKMGKNAMKAHLKDLMQLQVKHQQMLPNSKMRRHRLNDYVGRPLEALRGWPRLWSYHYI